MTTHEILSIAEFPDGIARAYYFRVYKCPSCPNAHIVLFDTDDIPFAQMTVGPENLRHINEDCAEVFRIANIGAAVLPFPRVPPK